MTRPPSSRPRAPRPPGATFDAKAVLGNERRRLNRLAARRRENDAVQARLAIAAAQLHAGKRDASSRVTIATQLADMLRTVATTWGLDITFTVDVDAPSINAGTENGVIDIRYPVMRATGLGTSMTDGDELTIDRVRTAVADVKGLGYHEVGHRLHTVPFLLLLEQAREHTYITPSAVLPLARAWSVLEDQRMEARMVADSPALGHYFATTVMRLITRGTTASAAREPAIEAWLLVAGRPHVPAPARAALRSAFVAARGEVHAATVERIIARYRAATDVTDMWGAVTEFTAFVADELDLTMPQPGLGDEIRALYGADLIPTDTPPTRGRQAAKAAPEESLAERVQRSATPATAGGDHGTNDLGDRDSGDPDADAATVDGDTETSDGEPRHRASATPTSPRPGTGASSAPDPHPATPKPTSPAEALRDALRALEELRIDDEVDAVVARIVTATCTRPFLLPRPRGTTPLAAHHVAQAELAAQLMVEALRECTVERAPTWQARQQRGVLDPFAFRTRQPGTRDFFRAAVGDGDLSNDLAVSLVLDVSGSMQPHEAHLGAAAYACKWACDRLDIPCTVTLFASLGHLLWDVGDEPTHLQPRAEGTTDPTQVCAALDEQRHGRAAHLVLMLTDGEFDPRFVGLDAYWAPDRTIVLVGLGAAVTRAHATTRGVHEVITISSVLDLPHTVTNVLRTLV